MTSLNVFCCDRSAYPLLHLYTCVNTVGPGAGQVVPYSILDAFSEHRVPDNMWEMEMLMRRLIFHLCHAFLFHLT